MANTTNSPSGNVDEHVVKMTFDNKQFEKNAQQSLDTVEKLKSSMNFEATVKGLDKLEDGVAQSNKALDSLNDSVDKIKDRFSNLGIIGVTALQNITNSVINTGKQMIKSLTITPIQSGFNEYELKMNSMKTIVASTRNEFNSEKEAITSVNAALNDLNKYSDETIYSFSDMTNNIGKFTNAGVKLDDAVNAIKGVSSEAALAGANANEASRAMYNFSQALSAGYVKLIDWKSIENANMATQDFKNNLLITAEALGTVKKQGDMYVTTTKNMNRKTSQAFNATKNFNDSLAHQWMTNKVLTTTLKAYATDVTTLTTAEKKRYEQELKQQGFNDKQIKQMEALGHKAMTAAKEINTFSKMVDTLQEAVQSSWAATSEYIFGTLDQAKKLWTNLEQSIESVIMAHNNLRNEVLQDWNTLGGRDDLIKAFQNLGKSIGSIFAPIRQAFLNVFHPFDEKGGLAKKLAEVTEKFKNFCASIKLTKEESADLREIFEGVFLIFKRVGQTIGLVIKTAGKIILQLRPVIDIILKIGSIISKVIKIVDDAIQKVIAVAKYLYDEFIGIQKTVDFIKSIFQIACNAINKALSTVGTSLDKIHSKMLMNADTAAKVADVIVKCIRAIYTALLYVVAYGQVALRSIAIAVGAIGITLIGGIKAIVAKIIGSGIFGKLFDWLDKQFSITAYAADKTGKKIQKSSKSTAKNVQADWNKLSTKDKVLVVFAALFEKLKAGVKNLVNLAKDGLNTVKNFFSNFISDVKHYGLGTAILNSFKTIGNGFRNLISTIVNGLKNANIPQPIKNFFGFLGNAIITVKNSIGDFFNFLSSKFPIIKTLQDMLKDVKKVFDEIFGVIDAKGAEKSGIEKVNKDADKAKDKFSGLKKIGEALANTFHRVADAIRDFTSSLSASKIVAFALSVILISMLAAITRLIWYIGSATNVIAKSLLPNISGLTSSLNTFVKGVNAKFFPTQKTFVLKIREMAEAVAILAGSVVILSTIDSNKLWPAVGAVIALLASMTGLTVVLMKFSKATSPEALASFKTAIASFIAIAAAIASIAVALKVMDSITDTDNLWKKLGAFLLGFAGFVATVTVAQKFWGKGLSLGNTVGILFFALSLKKIAKAIVFIAGIDFTKIQKGLKGFGVCVGLLAALAIAFGRSKWHSGMNAVGFAISLWLLIIPIKKLAKIDYSNFTKALNDCQGMIITLAVIAGSLMAIGMITKKGRSSLHATSTFLKSLGTVLLEITIAIGIMGTMKKSTLKKGITAVGFIMTFITASLGLLALGTKGVKVESSFKTIMGITLGVASLVGAVIVLGLVDTSILAKGTIVVGTLLTFFGVCLKLSSGAANVKMGPILAVMGSVIILGMLTAILGTLPLNQMIQGLAGMGTVCAMFGLLMSVLSGIDLTAIGSIKVLITTVGLIAGLAVAIGVLTGICAKYGAKNMIIAVAGLAGVIISLSILFGVLVPVGVTASAAAAVVPVILIGILVVSLVVLAVFGLMELIGGLVKHIPSAEKNLKGFVDFMGTLGESVGAVVAGFKKQINNEKLRYLKKQTKTLTDYLQSVADFDPEIIRAANGTLKAAAELIEAGGSTGFNNLGTFDFDGFGEILTQIANAIKSFKTATEDLDISDDDVNIFSTALSAFSKIVAASKGFKEKNINNLSEMLSVINGTGINSEDYSKASVGSGGFARTFSQTVKILREAKITKDDTELLSTFITMLGDIAAVAKTIPNSSGHGMDFSWASAIVGDNRLDDFLQMIAGTDGNPGLGATFASACKAMNDTGVTKENAAMLKKGVSVLADVASMSGEIPNSGGLLGAILGNNDLGPFLQAIAGGENGEGGLGAALSSAIKAMGDCDVSKENIAKLKNATSALAEIANVKGIIGDTTHPFIEWMETILNNKDTFTSFIDYLPEIGTSLAAAATSFAGVAPENVAKMSNTMRAISTMMSGLVITDSNGGESIANIQKFSEQLKKSGPNFKEFSNKIGGLDLDGMRSFANTIWYVCNTLGDSAKMAKHINDLGAKLSTLGTSMQTLSSVSLNWGESNTIANGLDPTSTDVIANRVNSKSKDIQDLIDSIKSIGEAAKEVDTTSVKNMTNVMSTFANMSKSVKTSIDGAAKAITNKKDAFKNKGKDLIDALISGMASDTKALENKVGSLCTIMKNKFSNDGVPAFKTSGINLLKGLKDGLSDQKTINSIKAKAESIAKTVIDSTNKGLDEHSPSKLSKKSGIYFLLGLKNGLEDRDSISKLTKSSKSLGKVIDGGVRAQLQIHSPSKVAIKTGGNFISGLIKGITGNKAISALTKGGQMVAKVLNGSVLGKLDPQKWINSKLKDFDISSDALKKGISEVLTKSGTKEFDKLGKKSYSQITKALDAAGISSIANDISKSSGIDNIKSGTGNGKGGKGSKGRNRKNSLGKALSKSAGLSEDDIKNVLNAYKKVFYKFTPELDKFNKKYVNKHGKIDANYIAHSFLNATSRRAAVYFSKNMAETINTEFGKYAKKNGLKIGTKAYYKELETFTHKYMVKAQSSMNKLYGRVETIGGKKGLNLVKNSPDLIGKYVKDFKYVYDKYGWLTDSITKNFNISKSGAKAGAQSFADYLWQTSDEGKENAKNLKASLKEEEKIRSQMKAEKDKIDEADGKAQKKKIKNAKDNMKSAEKAMKQAKKDGKYHNKTYKQWTNEYNKRKKIYSDLANQRINSTKKLSKLQGQYNETHKKTKEYIDAEAKGANKAFEAYKKNIEDTLKDYLKLSASNFKNPITAFQKKMYNGTQKFYESGKAAKQLVDYTYTQMKVYKNYQDDMKWAQSTASGLSASVVKYFKDAGYESYDELHKLRYATKEEIDELNGYFEESEQIKKRAFLQDATDKLQAVKDRDENIKAIAASGILSPEAIKDLIDQGIDAADLVSSIADDIKNNGGKFAKQYSDLFNEVGMSKLNDSQFITEETKSIMADLGYAWDEGTKQFVKSDTIQQTAGIAGKTFIDSLANYLKDAGMNNSAIKKVKNVLSPLAKETFTSFDDFIKEANKLDLDKVFKKSTLDKIERFAILIKMIGNATSTFENANNILGAITATANASTASMVSQPAASKDTSGAITVIDSTGKAVTTTSSSTNLQASKESTLNAIVDPKAQDTLKTSIDTTYTAQLVTNINDSMAKLLTEQNKKLDKLHNDNQRIYDTLNKTRSDLRATNGEVKNLKSAISHMRVQMDTGALVGAITPGVDKALGRKASSTRR